MKLNSNITMTLLVVVIVVLAGSIFYNKNVTPSNTVSTTGSHTLTVEPDEATVYVSIETLKNSADESKNENSRITNAVLDSLYEMIGKENVETSQFSIYPEYDWTNNGQKLKGYRTTNQLKVKTSNFDDIGKIVDVSTKAGATGINSINFELSKEKQASYKQEALTKAAEDAKGKAQAIVSGIGSRLGKVVSIQENEYYYRPYPLYTKGSGVELDQAVSTEILPTNLEVTASVTVTYSVK